MCAFFLLPFVSIRWIWNVGFPHAFCMRCWAIRRNEVLVFLWMTLQVLYSHVTASKKRINLCSVLVLCFALLVCCMCVCQTNRLNLNFWAQRFGRQCEQWWNKENNSLVFLPLGTIIYCVHTIAAKLHKAIDSVFGVYTQALATTSLWIFVIYGKTASYGDHNTADFCV